MIRRSLFLLAILSLLALSFAFAKGGDMNVMSTTANGNITYPLEMPYPIFIDHFNWVYVTSPDGPVHNCFYELDSTRYPIADCTPGEVAFSEELEDGDYALELFINYTDASGFKHPQHSLATRIFFVDTTLPQVDIIYPQAANYGNDITELSYILTETNPDSCWYSLDNGATTFPVVCGENLTGLTANEGSNTWVVGAQDKAGNTNSDSVTFLKDTIYPQIQITYPVDNERYAGVVTHVDFTINETNPNTCWFNDGTTTTNFDCSLATLSQSSHEDNNTWTVCINDTVNHEKCSSVTFWVDSIIPEIEFLNGTTKNGNYSQNYISVEVRVNDDNLDTLEINLYNSAGLVNSTVEHTSGTYSFDISGLPDETYYLNATVNDTTGHSNSTETRTVTLDTVAPVITLNAPDNNQPFAFDNNDISFSYNVSDAFASATCELYLNGTLNQTMTASTSNPNSFALNDLISGKYDWYVYCIDSATNNQFSKTRTFTVLSNLTFPDGTDYTNLSEVINISSVYFWIRNGNGSIYWTDPIDMSRGAKWSDYITLEFNKASVDTIGAYEFKDKKANITFYNISWKSPQILRDSVLCSSEICNPVSYTINVSYMFNVTSFSTYETIETPKESFSSSGGSSCTTNWTCTEWNLCIGNMQTRTCTKVKDYCNAITIKPEEKQSCIEQKSVNKTVEQAPSQEEAAQPEQQTRTGITGFVIAHPASTAATLIALLGLTSYFVVSRIRARNAQPDTKAEKKEGVTWISGKSTEKVKDI